MPRELSGQTEQLGTEDTLPPDPANVPVDGGLGWLIGSGIVYVLQKKYTNNKTK